MKEVDIIEQAIAKLGKTINVNATFKSSSSKVDGIFLLEKGNWRHSFIVKAKSAVKKEMLPLLLNALDGRSTDTILISQYIPGTLKEQLRKHKVNYLELAGNCYIDVPGLYVHINDQKVAPVREKPGKLWRETGLKFVFAILTSEDLLNRPYREIAEKAEISLGAVSGLVKELKSTGFAVEILRHGKQELMMEHKGNLIDQWAVVYNSTLRPKLSYGKFKSTLLIDGNSLGGDDYYWGGEMAAALVVRGFVAQDLTIYSWAKQADVMKKLRLIPNPDGDIEVISAFWSRTFNIQNKGPQCVPNLIIYADLLNSNDSRNREIAAKLKEQKF